ncbi:hypothetical protein ACHAXM_001902 [Skeletonema potamos]
MSFQLIRGQQHYLQTSSKMKALHPGK